MSLVEHWQKVLCRDASSENNLVYIVAIKLLVVAKVNKIKLASFICNDIYTRCTPFLMNNQKFNRVARRLIAIFSMGPILQRFILCKIERKSIYYSILYKKVRRNIKNITNVSAIIVFVNILWKFNRFITKIKEKNSVSLWIHKIHGVIFFQTEFHFEGMLSS